MPTALLSLVTWNSAESIEACLASVLAQSYTDFEVWVVDNDSYDDTCSRVAALAATDARLSLHQLPRNTGFCGGHNYSLDRTTHELVLLVNPDVEMAPDYLERAVAAIRQHEQIGTVCGLLLQSSEEDPRIDSAGMQALADGRFGLRLHGRRLSEVGALAQAHVDGADGALPLFRREFIDDLRVQGEFFDARFFAHKEDWDIAWRGRLYGWKTLFEPACRALHPRQFLPANLRLRRRLSGAIRTDAVKNQWLLLLKNTTSRQAPGLLLRALPRQLAILGYAALAERESLQAVRYLWQHWRDVQATRQLVQLRARQPWLPPAQPAGVTPLLSICVPTYHRPELLARALRSIGPLPAEVEVIISDNSTHNDFSEKVSAHVLHNQPGGRWRYYRNPAGGSAATNWVACVERARGHYILMLHDDDYLLPGGLLTMLHTLRRVRQQQHAVLFGVSVVDGNRQELQRQVPRHTTYLPPTQAVEALLTDSALVRIPALVVSREAYLRTGGPDPTQRDTDDTDLWLRVFAYGGVLQVPAVTAAYSVHDGALTTGMFQEQNIQLLLRIFQKARTHNLLPESRLRQAESHFFHQFVLAGAYRALRQHDAAGARKVLQLLQLPALRHLPVSLRWLPVRWGLHLLTLVRWSPPTPPRLVSWLRPSL
ncbi:glycosyltransferase family 2 protein [Hymenobacter metallilatus]|uniref:Glycosyltransferase n=1 Tax=Hymenobacter metallilatus TaxID=2493666 RepID=A0A3R9MTT4_9BACT|nr:glycosyltransferase [Hymenobacter metallilatus]RSK29818.1 glycosyltransferase [Hymenobacter metallilatus]